ncbi:hypothetical protein [Bradyrhizobium sp. USDA 4461]
MDDLYIERLWRSLKYEDIYLKAYSDGRETKSGLARWIDFCLAPSPGAGKPHADRGPASPAFGEQAVNMKLLASETLGQHRALPASPQPQPQQARGA